MLVIGSILNAAYGFSAIYNDDYVAEEEFLYGPVSLWGWLAVGIAVVMFATALGLFARSGIASLVRNPDRGRQRSRTFARDRGQADLFAHHPGHRRPDHLWACGSRIRSERTLEDEAVTEPEINEERITIVLVVSLMAWLAALIAAFWLIGAFAGFIVIIIGAGLLALALARVIRSGRPN